MMKKPTPVTNDAGQYITKTELAARGWPPSLIVKLLAEPDQTKANPVYKSKALMRLYLLERVEGTERDASFIAHQAKREKLSLNATRNARIRADALVAAVQAMTVTVEAIPLEAVLRLGVQNYQDRASARFRMDTDSASAPEHVRVRWAVNFARHRLTRYDRLLAELAGKSGVHLAVWEVRRKIFDAIAAQWPELADECERQKDGRRA